MVAVFVVWYFWLEPHLRLLCRSLILWTIKINQVQIYHYRLVAECYFSSPLAEDKDIQIINCSLYFDSKHKDVIITNNYTCKQLYKYSNHSAMRKCWI